MTSAAQRKGDGWALDVRDYLRSVGVEAHRLRPGGRNDEGDFAIGPFAGEAKNYPNDLVRAINEAMNEAVIAAQRTNRLPLAIVKRRGKPTRQGLAIMDLETLAKMLTVLVGRTPSLLDQHAQLVSEEPFL